MSLVMEPVARLTRDIRSGAATLGRNEARYLVDSYYAMQKDRISDDNQERALDEAGEPHAVLGWLADQHGVLERQIARCLFAHAAVPLVFSGRTLRQPKRERPAMLARDAEGGRERGRQ